MNETDIKNSPDALSTARLQGFCVQYIGLKGYRETTHNPALKVNDSSRTNTESESDQSKESPPLSPLVQEKIECIIDPQSLAQTHLPLFRDVIELQNVKLASLLRLLKCSPLLDALFVVFTYHRSVYTTFSQSCIHTLNSFWVYI
jgi:hypothetical protein